MDHTTEIEYIMYQVKVAHQSYPLSHLITLLIKKCYNEILRVTRERVCYRPQSIAKPWNNALGSTRLSVSPSVSVCLLSGAYADNLVDAVYQLWMLCEITSTLPSESWLIFESNHSKQVKATQGSSVSNVLRLCPFDEHKNHFQISNIMKVLSKFLQYIHDMYKLLKILSRPILSWVFYWDR